MRLGVLFLAAVLSIALSACSAEEATPLPEASASSPVAAPTPTPSVMLTPSAPATGDEPFVILNDEKGDGGDADITEVRMMTDGEGLTVLVKLAEDAPTTGTFAVFVNMASTDGEISRQLGMKWVDDEMIPPFSFDSATAQQTNYDDAPSKIDGKEVAALFPLEAIEGLGDSWQWQAVTSVEGNDEDFAPADGKSDFPS